MIKAPGKNNISLLFAITFFMLVAIILYVIAKHHDNMQRIEHTLEQSEKAILKIRYYSEMMEYARARTRMTSQIINTQDLFEQDEINQALEKYASRFVQVRNQLLKLPLEEFESKSLEAQAKIVQVILPAQREATQAAMHGDINEKLLAEQRFYRDVIPGQNLMIDILHKLITYNQEVTEQITAQTITTAKKDMHDGLQMALSVIILCGLLGIIIVRRSYQIQSTIEQSRDSLEERVIKRTAELEKARNEAEEANVAKSKFLSNMSHELRTPMNGILGFAQLLEYEDLSAETLDNVREIIGAGNHLLSLINEVLDFAKIESGTVEINMGPVKSDEVIEECCRLMNPLTERFHVNLEIQGIADETVWTDQVRLKQVILNLLSNAIKYNRPGGTVSIKSLVRDAEHLTVMVTDTGKGIAPEHLEDIFEPFNRLSAANSEIEGTGIGLTFTRNVLELMSGKIRVKSEPGVGSTFSIELPLFKHESGHRPENQESKEDHPPMLSISQNKGKKYTVLYVEDSPPNLKLMERILNQYDNIELLSAHTPYLGIEFAKTRKPDLILLDINMMGMDGYEVYDIFKKDPRLKEVPIFAITASAMLDDIQRGLDAGFDEYLTKPLNVPHFIELLDKHLPPDSAQHE